MSFRIYSLGVFELTYSCLEMQPVTRACTTRPHRNVQVRLGAPIWVVVELVPMLERVARRGRSMRSGVHVVFVVVVVCGRVEGG